MTDALDKEIEELEKARADAAESLAKEEKAQYVVDLKARIALEEKHGPIAAVKVTRYVRGFPTRAFVKTPGSAEYGRYKKMTYQAHDRKSIDQVRVAGDTLAESSWVYPETKEERDAMLEAFPGLLSSILIAATALAEGKAEEEGKG